MKRQAALRTDSVGRTCMSEMIYKRTYHEVVGNAVQLELSGIAVRSFVLLRDMWLVGFWVAVVSVGLLLNVYLKRLKHFWKKYNVPHLEPSFPLGDLQGGKWRQSLGFIFKDFYDQFPMERFFGIWMFVNPLLLVKDLDLIKTIFVKDFNFFQNRNVYYNEKDDPLSAHLFSIEGLKWKNLRIKLTPTFTSGKMKMMFPLVVECTEELKEHLRVPAERGDTVEVKDVVARLMTDIISLCAFGIRTNSLRDPDSKFREMGRKSIQPSFRRVSVLILQLCCPKLAEVLRLRVIPTDVSEYFLGAVKDVMDGREKQRIKRNDFMQLLIQLKETGIIKESEDQVVEAAEKLSFEEVAAEAFLFFLAGFETSSSTVQFALFELAKNPEIQDKLRSEINCSLEQTGNKLTYEGTREIPYLDQVIDETLRKYPVVPTLQRQCNQDYQIPGSDAVIPKGTVVHVPVYAIHMDEKYYPQPEEFRPERFSEEEKQKRHHFAYLPFGEGPRNCIGKRFGQMQVRVALIVLLQNFKFEISEKQKLPIQFDPKSFVLSVKGGIHLKVTRA